MDIDISHIHDRTYRVAHPKSVDREKGVSARREKLGKIAQSFAQYKHFVELSTEIQANNTYTHNVYTHTHRNSDRRWLIFDDLFLTKRAHKRNDRKYSKFI